MDQVDEFLERAHRALEAGDGSLTARDVQSARFKPRRWSECYDMGAVDVELDRIAAALRAFDKNRLALEPPTPLHQLRFPRVRFQPAYDVLEVDRFFQRAHHALEVRDGSLTAAEVEAASFKLRFKEGYEMGEVDDELDRIAGAMGRLESTRGD